MSDCSDCVIDSLGTATDVAPSQNAIAAGFGGSGGAVLVGFQQAGTGPIVTTVDHRLKANAAIEDFLPGDYDPTTDDASVAMMMAAQWSADNNATVTFERYYRLAHAVLITQNNVRFNFVNARFDILDTDLTATLTNGAKGPVGILVQNAAHVSLTGTAHFMGQGAVGATRLAGVVFDTCDFAESGSFFFDTMAAGMFTVFCNGGAFGPVSANAMNGIQTFGDPLHPDDAGTARVVAGCSNCHYGPTLSIGNHKPIVYLSTISRTDGQTLNTVNCTFETISGTGQAGSLDSSILALRAAVRCRFTGINGSGFNVGLNISRYSTDAGYAVDGNDIGSVVVAVIDSSASVVAGITIIQQDPSMIIGHTHIGHVEISGPSTTSTNQIFGMLLAAGSYSIDSIRIDGTYFGIRLYTAILNASTIQIGNMGGPAFQYCQGAAGRIKQIDVVTGSLTGAQTAVVTYVDTIPDGGAGGVGAMSFDNISYVKNGTGADPTYVLFDSTNNTRTVRVNNIAGSGTSDQARFGTFPTRIGDGLRKRPFSIPAESGVAPGGQTTPITLSWPGIRPGDAINMSVDTAVWSTFMGHPECFANDQISFQQTNIASVSQTRPARTIRIGVSHVG